MSGQQFCLRWNNHQPNFISVCSSLLNNGTLVDVTLAAEGKQLQAHKIVLSACSSYFQALFTTNPCQHPIVILKDVQYNDLKTMVDFMYYGEVNVSQEQLPHILKTAEMLKIKGLAEMPADAATLTKSESKSSVEQTPELHGSIGTNTSGAGCSSGADSIWGSTESQQQHQQQYQQQSMHQQKRTPSPVGINASPSTRRKRLRKTSNNGSGERNSEDHSSLETGGMNMGQLGQMSFAGSSPNLSQNIHAKIIKDGSGVGQDIETHHHSSHHHHHPHDSSQESIDEATHAHHLQHIKPEADIITPQSIPLDISDATTPDHETSNANQSAHTVTSQLSTQLSTESVGGGSMGPKRNRFLIRQSRVKRDSDTISSQVSPDIEFDPLTATTSAGTTSCMLQQQHQINSNLLTVPTPKIERHSSEPAPNMAASPPTQSHLLNVPQHHHQHPTYLVKQHSHPLLPSQQTHLTPTSSSSGHMVSFELQRQYSHPIPPSVESPGYLTTTTPPIVSISSASGSNQMHFSVTTPSIKTEQHNVPASMSISSSANLSSSSVILVSEPQSSSTLTVNPSSIGLSSSFEHTHTLRVRNEELHRSVSSPAQTSRELSLENTRSSHCPAIRPGPALGCNFCWNTIDSHGRILRRKTKYHCPECQTNLCIVPCFQEYHEKQTREPNASSTSSASSDQHSNNKNFSTGGNVRQFPKTESI